MTEMAAMHIHGKNPQFENFLPGTSWAISITLGMQHLVLKLTIVCSNDNTGLTLTYFTGQGQIAT